MFGVATSDDYQPVTWVGRHPVHVTTLLVAVHALAAIVACFLGGTSVLSHLAFDSAAARAFPYRVIDLYEHARFATR